MNESNQISLKDAYEELWHCRDFELKHLWQRSIFLGAFLLGAFAGYGKLVLQCCEKDHAFGAKDNVVGFGVAIIGLVLSFLWIMLAKGSKAWYERYESAICSFGKIAELDKADLDGMFENPKAQKLVAFAYGKHFKKYSEPVSSWLWDTKGGPYSPSKINIAIGHLSVLFWIAAIAFHVSVAQLGVKMVAGSVEFNYGLGTVMLAIALFGILFFWLYARTFLKSGILEEKQ